MILASFNLFLYLGFVLGLHGCCWGLGFTLALVLCLFVGLQVCSRFAC